jgi:predicted aspartyl protease
MMNPMKKIKYIGGLLLMIVALTSCLKKNLEPSNYAMLNAISDVQFEYRWTVKNAGGVDVLKFQAITVAKTIDATAKTVTVALTVPAATTGDFNAAVRANVTRANLASFFFVSTGASVKPLNNSPVLGTVGDFSADNYQYQIISASGDIVVWTINIAAFNKP